MYMKVIICYDLTNIFYLRIDFCLPTKLFETDKSYIKYIIMEKSTLSLFASACLDLID
mgnify:CR=1 FL=1